MTDFSGKNILVLGGSRGIGAAIVRRFAADGGSVAFTYAGSRAAAEALQNEKGAQAVLTHSADRAVLTATVADAVRSTSSWSTPACSSAVIPSRSTRSRSIA